MYSALGLIIGLVIGYALSGVTIGAIESSLSLAGDEMWGGFAQGIAQDLVTRLLMYLGICGFVGMILGSFMDKILKKNAVNSPDSNMKTPHPTASKAQLKQCPKCAEDIKKEAIVCRYCKSELQ